MIQGWQEYLIEDLGTISTGTTPSTSHPEYYGGNYKFISPVDLNNGKYISTSHKLLTAQGLKVSRTLPKKAILVGCIGNIGKIGMTVDEISAFNQQINAIVCNDNFDSDFIYYLISFKRPILEQKAVKTTLPILNKGNFQKIKIHCPPLQEQKKIAYILSTIQKAIEQQDKLIRTTTELKKALMQKLFTEGTRGEKQKQTEIGLVPESWEVVQLGNIANFKNGVNFTKEEKGEVGILTIDVKNMYGKAYTIDTTNLYRVNKDFTEEYILKTGDLLFVRSSLKLEGVGWTSMFLEQAEPITFCGFIIRARINVKELYPPFLTYYFRTEFARNMLISGSGKVAITNINQGVLNSASVPKPEINEQKEIIRQILLIERKIENHENRKQTLNELFKTLLQQLMTGQILVNELTFEQSLPDYTLSNPTLSLVAEK